MIIRYFTNKQALFTAAVDLPLERLPSPGVAVPRTLAPLITAFVEAWDTDPTFSGLLRSSATNPEAAATMRSVFEQRVSGALSPWSNDSEDQAAILGAMLVGLAWGRTVIGFKRLRALSGEEIARLAVQLIQC